MPSGSIEQIDRYFDKEYLIVEKMWDQNLPGLICSKFRREAEQPKTSFDLGTAYYTGSCWGFETKMVTNLPDY